MTLCTMSKHRIVLARHGESEWNSKNLFCGWVDVNLSDKGRQESRTCGRALREAGFSFDVIHTSMLRRAYETVQIILEELGWPAVKVQRAWQLNERHYGGLTGINKAQAVHQHGAEQVAVWRRSYDVLPPVMQSDHPYHDEILTNPALSSLSQDHFPSAESLLTTEQRVVPYWTDVIVPQVKAHKCVLVVAHGTSLRGLVKHIQGLSKEAVMQLNLPNGIPFVYELDENMKPLGALQYLADEQTVEEAIARVATVQLTTD